MAVNYFYYNFWKKYRKKYGKNIEHRSFSLKPISKTLIDPINEPLTSM